ncbi:glycoside hydrolase family 43 protein [Paenibacillus sp. GYB003]|uniref:glycoside hydrolase family 43 protein n=1 Tax=Paenibacillus sp. GYB003 TaxID=2994392 RepID=UPI002F96216F
MSITDRLSSREPWVSDQGDGTFANPVLHADYSDPDVVKVGGDFYMTASSFGHIPGLPILRSNDLVNWRLIGHAIRRMELPGYDKPQHGNGVWAPSIRHHDGKFWIFYGDPDVGIFMTTAVDPAGEWSPPHLVHAGKGLIDTCPFWDDDGRAYLVHAYANSRCGIKHKLRVCRMSPDGTRLLDEGAIVYDGERDHPTLEGPKLYKKDGYYYIFAPAGGVATGWQVVFRSKSVFGPYEDKIVLRQGDTPVNGPHQGGWVELDSGESWFLHFQDKGAYGRIVHLQPVRWRDGWPLMGEDRDGDGVGEPVLRMRKPNVGRSYPIETPAASDEFDAAELGLQWQWQANPQESWYRLEERPSHLRLYAVQAPHDAPGLYMAPQLLLQKFPAPSFEATAKLDGSRLAAGERAGIVVFGYSYATLSVLRTADGAGGLAVSLTVGDKEGESELWREKTARNGNGSGGGVSVGNEEADGGGDSGALYLRVTVTEGARCAFAWSADGVSFRPAEAPVFEARKGHWVGAKTGLFAISGQRPASAVGGYADVDWFRVSAVEERSKGE